MATVYDERNRKHWATEARYIEDARADAAKVLVRNRNPDLPEHKEAVRRLFAIDEARVEFSKAWKANDLTFRLPNWPRLDDPLAGLGHDTPLLTPPVQAASTVAATGVDFDDVRKAADAKESLPWK